jgi:para-aminobenzoate synthetase component I
MFIDNNITKKISLLASQGEEFFFLIDFTGEKSEVLTPPEASHKGIYYWFEGNSNYTNSIQEKYKPDINQPFLATAPKPIKFQIFPVSFNYYLKSFTKVQEALRRGDTYLLNLTFKTRIETDYSLEEIFRRSTAKYKLLYQDKFVVFSPERFIMVKDGFIETRPMKGTISASVENAEARLLSNTKELYEHNTIVDLLRNDLNMVASDVIVENFRYIDRIKTNKGDILQVSSAIKGKLPTDYKNHLGELIASLLPAGSVTGAPKERTVELINQIENYERGFYTGIFGYFDGNRLESAVCIRYIEKEDGILYYKSGGGITALSIAREEYDELISKIYVPVF